MNNTITFENLNNSLLLSHNTLPVIQEFLNVSSSSSVLHQVTHTSVLTLIIQFSFYFVSEALSEVVTIPLYKQFILWLSEDFEIWLSALPVRRVDYVCLVQNSPIDMVYTNVHALHF